ncbi:D-lactate dehydrogenase [Robbsia sp. Bb-Pol-6]|uniref:Quinone-dependent D-lactate dehydrogenase n=1 Tax=Robbsia betulipollinis TaxID=2981849 RepID=A0ABT3ZQZ9_9BURK|nr:D-lactate dehydrogenase [Robbsia betulipollinis]MCY0388984.1 D-lactate dehydrogenase [Robbsia betulipollinis]
MAFDIPKTASSRVGLALCDTFRRIVGTRYVLTDERATRRYRIGYRYGSGVAAVVVRPGTLVEQWQILEQCIAASVIVITQASNTGLTGGSTPDGDDYDRDIVIVSTSRIRQVYPIAEGRQVVCLAGATLDQLERVLEPLGREPHSVIGSSCIGASVIGGICNNSGGSLVHRGPAYTEMAAYGCVDASGRLRLVNHLGIRLGESAERILARLDAGDLPPADIAFGDAAASDRDYARHVRGIDEASPARYNADPLRLHEASGSAGKLMVFAVRLDTFPITRGAKVFYIGTNHTHELTDLRRHALARFAYLPIAGEYLHRDAYDIAERYGRDLFLIIQYFGTHRLPAFFGFKTRCDAFFDGFRFLPRHVSDRILQRVSRLFPRHLPARMNTYRDRYAHHVMLKVQAEGVEEVRTWLQDYFSKASGDFFECTPDEGKKAFLHRFAAASAAVRYRAVHSDMVEDIVALDVALRRDDREWFETLPADMAGNFILKLYYGHFLCHVFHQDYVARKGSNCTALEHALLRILDERGAKYPAEHNVGHLYEAAPELQAFYRKLDPCNCFNPGIGLTSKLAHYRGSDAP